MRASQPSAVTSNGRPSASTAFRIACAERRSGKRSPGSERHPSDSSSGSASPIGWRRDPQLRVDRDAAPALVRLVGPVEDEHPQRHADLRGGEADPRRGLHRLEQVVHEIVELVVELGDLRSRLMEHGIARDADRADGHSDRISAAEQVDSSSCRRTLPTSSRPSISRRSRHSASRWHWSGRSSSRSAPSSSTAASRGSRRSAGSRRAASASGPCSRCCGGRRWVIGTALLGLAILFQLTSLSLSPLIVVQPLGALALVITAIVNARGQQARAGPQVHPRHPDVRRRGRALRDHRGAGRAVAARSPNCS